jgi:hypothetical protein
MSQTLNLTNFGTSNIIDQTQLLASANAGASSISVLNTTNFATSGYLLIGPKGSNGCEMLQAGTVSTETTIPLGSNTLLNHNQYDPVFALFGNQLNIYRAANVDGTQPADTAFTLLTTITIDADNDTTSYTDGSGGGNYWYKYTHYNSFTAAETDIGSSRAVRGNFTVDYCSLDEIRNEAGFANSPFIGDDKIDIARQAAQDEINGTLDEFYDIPLQPPINDYLKRIVIRMAAGYLRLGQYSSNQDPKVNGQAMVDDAQAQLLKLSLKERDLITKDGTNLAGPGATGGIEGWPNSSTSSSPGSEGGAPRVFRMSDIQGQPMTNDPSGNPVGNLYFGRKF